MFRAISIVALLAATAVAQPAHPPPTTDEPPAVPLPTTTDPTAPAPTAPTPPTDAPPLAPARPVVKPPYVTVSTMPVSREVPDTSPDDEPYHRALIASAITGGLVVATVGWYLYENRFEYIDKSCTPNFDATGTDLNDCNALVASKEAYFLHRQKVWSEVMWPLGAATLTSAFITAYMWSRHHKAPHTVISVAPTTNGASASLGFSF